MAAHVETVAKRDEISNCGWVGCGRDKIVLEFVGQPSPQGCQFSYFVLLDICGIMLEFSIIQHEFPGALLEGRQFELGLSNPVWIAESGI